MKILYLHGLESKLSAPKRIILENFGSVIAPDINYYTNDEVFKMLRDLISKQAVNVVIGSSMGGFMGYYFANTFHSPALLFNPALPHRPVKQHIPELLPNDKKLPIYFALGGQDEVINANDTLRWLAANRLANNEIKMTIHSQMGHPIPLDVFESEVNAFFKELADRTT
jgi:predicted esterase